MGCIFSFLAGLMPKEVYVIDRTDLMPVLIYPFELRKMSILTYFVKGVSTMAVLKSRFWKVILVLVLALGLAVPSTVLADSVADYVFATPVFGLAVAPDGSLLVADAGAGIVELRNGQGSLVVELPGVADIAPIGRGVMYAITGGGEGELAGKLFLAARGKTQLVADLRGFEAAVNPDGGEIDSNPYDVALVNGGKVLVADAGGNSLLMVNKQGAVDWVATFPMQFASTEQIKNLVGCPNPPPGLEFACDLPDVIPAEAVPTSVVVGPDGAYYVGELTGFPGALGVSRVWRIEAGTLHAECGTSPACSVVASGFTSIVDLAFGPDGTLYVVEMDEAGFMAAELAFFGLPGLTQGGTVNACTPGTWVCTERATGLPLPLAVAVDGNNTLFAAIMALVPGAAQVVSLP